MRVSLDNLRPDMVLSADIVDGGGRLLLPTGTSLTDKHLRYCQMWGVLEAEVAGDEPPPTDDDALDPDLMASVESQVRPLFQHCDLSHPAVDALFRYCVLSRARRRAV